MHIGSLFGQLFWRGACDLQVIRYAEYSRDPVRPNSSGLFVCLAVHDSIESNVSILNLNPIRLAGVNRILIERRETINGTKHL